MNVVIQILDVVAAISIIICLNMVTKNHKWWLFYSATNVAFSIVTICKWLPALTIMGFVLCITGIRNYQREERKKREK